MEYIEHKIDIYTQNKIRKKIMIEEYNGKAKCSIHSNVGGDRCKDKATKYIFGISLCDNHYHILYNMSNNVINKDKDGYAKLEKILLDKMGEE